MGRGSGDNGCSKLLLILLNGIFLICGLGILALGIYLKVDPSYSTVSRLFNVDMQQDAAKTGSSLVNLDAVSIVIIIIGSVIAAISIVGMLGACFELRLLIVVYGIVITIMLLGLLAIGIAAIVFKYALRKDVEIEFRKAFQDQIVQFYEGEVERKNSFTISADIFQIYFECCGVNNYTDFKNAQSWRRTLPDGTIAKAPIACCKFNSDQRNAVLKGQFPNLFNYDCARNPTSENSNANVGCLTPLNSYLDKILLAVLIITLLVGFVLIIGSVASCCMCCRS